MDLKEVASKQAWWPDVQLLDELFRSHGEEIRIVGGAVRDLISGKDPKDVDLSTSAVPRDVRRIIESSRKKLVSRKIKTIPTGIEHGTVTVVLDGTPFEVTTLRVDKQSFGRKAEVSFTSDWKQDALRRDLTINAMSMDVNGTVFDYFGGVRDLEEGYIRFVGDPTKRIREDYLRVLRYFRFMAKDRDAKYDMETLGIIGAEADGLETISGERIWSELRGILSGMNRYKVLHLMRDCRVTNIIGLPITMKGLSVIDHHDWAYITRGVPEYAVAALCTPDDVDRLRRRMKFSNEEHRLIKRLSGDERFRGSKKELEKRLALGEDPQMLLHDCAFGHNFPGHDRVKRHLSGEDPAPKFPLSGDDLIAAGMKTGPELGQRLSRLRDLWVDSSYKLTKDGLMHIYKIDTEA